MAATIFEFIAGSESRKKIIETLFQYPRRQWSCSMLEDATKLPHATVFRTMRGCVKYGLLKSIKINRKDIIFELVKDSPLVKEINNILTLDTRIAKKIAEAFVEKIKNKEIYSIVLYGSSITGLIKPDSDIDLLVVIKKRDKHLEKQVHDSAADISLKMNKTIALLIMEKKDMVKEKKTQFITSVQSAYEVLYGEDPF